MKSKAALDKTASRPCFGRSHRLGLFMTVIPLEPVNANPSIHQLLKDAGEIMKGIGLVMIVLAIFAYKTGYWSVFSETGALLSGANFAQLDASVAIVVICLGLIAWIYWIAFSEAQVVSAGPYGRLRKIFNYCGLITGMVCVSYFMLGIGGLIVATCCIVFGFLTIGGLIRSKNLPGGLCVLCLLFIGSALCLGMRAGNAVKAPSDFNAFTKCKFSAPRVRIETADSFSFEATYLGRLGEREYFYEPDSAALETVNYLTTAIKQIHYIPPKK